MSNLAYQVRHVSLLLLAVVISLFRALAASCVNSPYTALMENHIAHLEWRELTHADYMNATSSAFTQHETCGHILDTEHTPYNHKTLCPWDYVQDHDPNRFPAVLSVARCRCTTCFDNFQCTPVLYSIPVLMKQCNNGVIHWVRKTQLVSVACTCSRPTIRHVRKRLSKLFNLNGSGHR